MTGINKQERPTSGTFIKSRAHNAPNSVVLTCTFIAAENAEGTIFQIDVFTFEGAFSVARDTLDINDVDSSDLVDESSGNLVPWRVYSYENDRLVENRIDTIGDGYTDWIERFSHNPDATLSTTSLSSLSDGVISFATYTYELSNCNRNAGNTFSDSCCVGTE